MTETPEILNHVYHLAACTMTITLFPYGGGWRVKYTKTSNCPANSRLLAHDDVFFNDRGLAEKAFDEIDSVCCALEVSQ